MRQTRRDKKLYSTVAIGLCSLFFICLMANSSLSTGQGRYTSMSGHDIGLAKIQFSTKQIDKTYFFTEVYENSIFRDIEYHLISNRNIQDVQNVLLRVFNVLIPFVGQGILFYCFGCVMKKKKRIKSIMAVSLGGHAPPQRWVLHSFI